MKTPTRIGRGLVALALVGMLGGGIIAGSTSSALASATGNATGVRTHSASVANPFTAMQRGEGAATWAKAYAGTAGSTIQAAIDSIANPVEVDAGGGETEPQAVRSATSDRTMALFDYARTEIGETRVYAGDAEEYVRQAIDGLTAAPGMVTPPVSSPNAGESQPLAVRAAAEDAVALLNRAEAAIGQAKDQAISADALLQQATDRLTPAPSAPGMVTPLPSDPYAGGEAQMEAVRANGEDAIALLNQAYVAMDQARQRASTAVDYIRQAMDRLAGTPGIVTPPSFAGPDAGGESQPQ